MLAQVGHPQDMDTGAHPDCDVCVAVDMHYLGTGGARAAAVLAANAHLRLRAGRTHRGRTLGTALCGRAASGRRLDGRHADPADRRRLAEHLDDRGKRSSAAGMVGPWPGSVVGSRETLPAEPAGGGNWTATERPM
jgi:hypothetical protein